MRVDEQRILKEIEKISKSDPTHASLQRGKTFYDPLGLPSLLAKYITQNRLNQTDAAELLGISRDSVLRIVGGIPLSDSMLFRVRKAIETKARSRSRKDSQGEGVFPGDWCQTSSSDVQAAISTVSERLIFLKRVIEESNSINADPPSIDPIQKAQLIALLEATLAAVSAPFVERRQTRGFFRWLVSLGRRSVEKGIEKKVSDAIDGAVQAGEDMLQRLPDASSTDLGNIIT